VHDNCLQFGEALRRIAVIKYSRISSPTAAWRILIERHILQLSEVGGKGGGEVRSPCGVGEVPCMRGRCMTT
jgi:hypothetical protein